ncbi:phosphotransferase [Neptunomonas sp.]|uniref:phosphotransferase n=1 Tax=Neptunomonas sp. TaxID=1971898 RepID=UPI0025D4CF00|nr:phosphotransferase [Neptunomonas sp.]
MKQSQLLANINIQLSESVQWKPLLHAGTTNQLYTGSYQEQAVVLRVNAEQQVLGVCRKREEKVLNQIGSESWAPVIFQQELPDETQSGWLLMQRYTTVDSTPVAELRAQILGCVSGFQSIKSLPVYDYHALWNAYQEKIDDLDNSSQAQVLLNSIRALMLELNTIVAVECCLVHHDLHKGNLLSSAGQLIIIDWEYAGLGTPWLDAAALVSEFLVSPKAVAALPAFRNIDSETFEHGINTALHINKLLNQLWHGLSGYA